jgi:hypothetical protein
MQPYLSKEVVQFRLQFNTIKTVFAELFEWIRETVSAVNNTTL